MAGFQLVNTESQGDVTGKLKTFDLASSHSTRIGIGDVVVITGDADGTTGRQQVDQGNTSSANTGVVAGIEPVYSGESLSQTHIDGSTAGTVRVNVDPGALYEVEVANGPLTAGQAGQNVGIDNSEGTLSNGLFTSEMKIDQSTVATTSTLPFRIEEILEDSDGNYGEKAIVRVNESTSMLGATGIS